jgi:MFS family permease
MYLTTVSKPVAVADASAAATADHDERRISPNVVALGSVSLVTDISSEMVTAVLPLYLVLGLHLGPAAYGAVDGLYTGATALLRLAGGYIADRVRHRKAVAGVGYAISAVAKLGLLAAGPHAGAIGGVIAADRAGKGLRTAPRDALITLSTPERHLGRAFGVHRMMDSIGAFAGPLVALLVLALSHQAYDAVFVTSFFIAAFAVGLLVLFVRDPGRSRRPRNEAVGSGLAESGRSRRPRNEAVGSGLAESGRSRRPRDEAVGSGLAESRRDDRPRTATPSPRVVLDLLRVRGIRRLLFAAAVLGLATIGDGFVYLLLQRRMGVAIGWFPLLAVGTNLAYLALARPLGTLADRVGRLPVVIGGYTALVAVYLLLFGPVGGWPLLLIALALYGAFYAATDGILMALAGPVIPADLRTTGLSLIQTAQALAYLVSSVGFGLAWQYGGAAPATRIAAVAAAGAVVVTLVMLRPATRRGPR